MDLIGPTFQIPRKIPYLCTPLRKSTERRSEMFLICNRLTSN